MHGVAFALCTFLILESWRRSAHSETKGGLWGQRLRLQAGQRTCRQCRAHIFLSFFLSWVSYLMLGSGPPGNSNCISVLLSLNSFREFQQHGCKEICLSGAQKKLQIRDCSYIQKTLRELLLLQFKFLSFLKFEMKNSKGSFTDMKNCKGWHFPVVTDNNCLSWWWTQTPKQRWDFEFLI